ncbi:MAG: glycosyltransferase family 4 protein [Candidatus Anstonellales archaeon]
MKISIPLRAFHNYGGISRCIWELSKNYSHSHEVHIFSSQFESPPFKVSHHPVFSFSSPPFLAELSFAINSQKALDSFFSDIVYSPATACYKADVFTANSCHKAAVELFSQQRGHMYSFLKALEPKSRIVIEIEKRNYQQDNYQKITAISKRTKEELMQYYNVPADDIVVIYPGVDTDIFKPSTKSRILIRKKYSIPANIPILLFCGHEFKRKGLAQLITALAKVKRDWRLIVIGGDKKDYYENLARKHKILDKILFLGFVKSLADVFNGSDVFVFPTTYEPYGMVITEALSSGLPVVTSKIAGAAELMTHGKEGFLLDDPFDILGISEYIDTLLADEKLRKRMGKYARNTATKYNWKKISMQMMSVFEKVINEKR